MAQARLLPHAAMVLRKRPSRAGCVGVGGARAPDAPSAYQVLKEKLKKKEKKVKELTRKLRQETEGKKEEKERREEAERELAVKVAELGVERERRQDLLNAEVRVRLEAMGIRSPAAMWAQLQ